MPEASTSSRHLLALRREHPARRLLAALTGPVVIAALKSLFDESLKGIDIDAARQLLAESLQQAHEAGEIEADGDYRLQARREIRQWIRDVKGFLRPGLANDLYALRRSGWSSLQPRPGEQLPSCSSWSALTRRWSAPKLVQT